MDLDSASESKPSNANTADTLRLESGAQFLSWLHTCEGQLQEAEDRPWRQFQGRLQSALERVNTLGETVDTGLEELTQLGQQYAFVSEKSTSLHTACQHLLR